MALEGPLPLGDAAVADLEVEEAFQEALEADMSGDALQAEAALEVVDNQLMAEGSQDLGPPPEAEDRPFCCPWCGLFLHQECLEHHLGPCRRATPPRRP